MAKTTVKIEVNKVEVTPLASFDLGNAHAKIETADLQVEFRSILGRLSASRRFGDHQAPVFTFEGVTYAYGDEGRDFMAGDPISFNDMTRYIDPGYRRLFAAALWRSFESLATEGVIYPVIVSSLPASVYREDGMVEAVKDNLSGKYVIDGLNGKTLHAVVRPDDLVIIPEGVGTYFTALQSGAGISKQEVAIIDVGYYTTDLIFMNKGVYVADSARSTKHGVRLVATMVHDWLVANEGYQGDIMTVDNALESGTIQIGNKCVSIIEKRDEGYHFLAEQIIPWYFSNRGSRQPGTVLLSGGGGNGISRCISERLIEDGWRVIAGNPRRANVGGGFQFVKARQAKKVNA